MSTTPVRVAVVGTGGWGRQHARVFSSRTDAELVAICGRTPAKTEALAAEYDSSYAYPLTHYVELDSCIVTYVVGV